MPVVRIPSLYRKYVNGKSKVEVEGTTVSEIIDNLQTDFPGLKNQICHPDGEVKSHVNIYVEMDEINALDGLESKVSEKSMLSIVPAVAGG